MKLFEAAIELHDSGHLTRFGVEYRLAYVSVGSPRDVLEACCRKLEDSGMDYMRHGDYCHFSVDQGPADDSYVVRLEATSLGLFVLVQAREGDADCPADWVEVFLRRGCGQPYYSMTFLWLAHVSGSDSWREDRPSLLVNLPWELAYGSLDAQPEPAS